MKLKILVLLVFCIGIAGCGDHTSYLGEGYEYIYGPGGPFKCIVNPNRSVIIKEHVLEVVYDSTYIIAAQRPFDSVPECDPREGKKYTECKTAMLKTSTFKQYWIINKKIESKFITDTKTYTNVFGLYDIDSYLLIREEMNIPSELILK